MDLTVLFPDAPSPSTLRSIPKDLASAHVAAPEALDFVRSARTRHVLFIEGSAYVGAQAFSVARSLDARGGILGGCANDAAGPRRFGTVFASVPYGPYPVEPFALVDSGAERIMPGRDAIDAVAAGAYLVDRQAFIDVGGFDPSLSAPWRVFDLCAKLRERGRPVRWEPSFTFSVESGVVPTDDIVSHRDFMAAWSSRIATRYDLEALSRGSVRRVMRLPMGQRETLTIPLPPTEIILVGEGPLASSALRSRTHANRVSVRDARGDSERGLHALREALRTRSDRYLAVVDASARPEEGFLERTIMELETRPSLRGIVHEHDAVLAVSRLPLHLQPADSSASALDALESLIRARTGRRTSMSIVYVSHVRADFHRTSFEGVYGGELDIDYHVVATPERPETVDVIRTHPTLDLILDDTRGMARGVNAALSRAKGDIVVIIGDDFYPPPDWLEGIREAFRLRPDLGILGLSAVFVDGPQSVAIAYPDITGFKTAAARRRAMYSRDAKLTDQLTALVLAVDADALHAVGGFDERLGIGPWGIQDLTLRMRCAGYHAYVAEDLFAHHFQPADCESFLYDVQEEARHAEAFAKKWAAKDSRIDALAAIRRGFDPDKHFVPLKDFHDTDRPLRARYDTIFVASCVGEGELERAVAALRKYVKSFSADDPVLFAIGVGGSLQAESVGARARAICRKLERSPNDAADVAIVGWSSGDDWMHLLPEGERRPAGCLEEAAR